MKTFTNFSENPQDEINGYKFSQNNEQQSTFMIDD